MFGKERSWVPNKLPNFTSREVHMLIGDFDLMQQIGEFIRVCDMELIEFMRRSVKIGLISEGARRDLRTFAEEDEEGKREPLVLRVRVPDISTFKLGPFAFQKSGDSYIFRIGRDPLSVIFPGELADRMKEIANFYETTTEAVFESMLELGLRVGKGIASGKKKYVIEDRYDTREIEDFWG